MGWCKTFEKIGVTGNLTHELRENINLQEQFLTVLMHLVHKLDKEKIAAGFQGTADIRDFNQVKNINESQFHIGRCEACRERLSFILEDLVIISKQKYLEPVAK